MDSCFILEDGLLYNNILYKLTDYPKEFFQEIMHKIRINNK